MNHFEFNIADSPKKLFKKIRDNLVSMRTTTNKPKTLEWQVHLYDFILSRKDSDQAIEKYMAVVRDFVRSRNVAGFQDKLSAAAEAVEFTEPMPPEDT